MMCYILLLIQFVIVYLDDILIFNNSWKITHLTCDVGTRDTK
jgi:hypothetical protein